MDMLGMHSLTLESTKNGIKQLRRLFWKTVENERMGIKHEHSIESCSGLAEAGGGSQLVGVGYGEEMWRFIADIGALFY
jgi:hypothetical protein